MKTTDLTSGKDGSAFEELQPDMVEGSENLENNGEYADEISNMDEISVADEISKKEDSEDFTENLTKDFTEDLKDDTDDLSAGSGGDTVHTVPASKPDRKNEKVKRKPGLPGLKMRPKNTKSRSNGFAGMASVSISGGLIKNLKISKKLSLLIVLFIICMICISSFSFYAINDIKINGGLYQEIVTGKDLVADLQSPTVYIVEAYAAVQEMANSKIRSDIVDLSEKLKRIHKDYDESIAYWSERINEEDVRKELLENSYTPANQFFDLVESQYIPAVLAGDLQKTQELVGKLRPLYVVHTRSVEKVNALIAEDNLEREQIAAASIRNSVVVLLTVNIIGLVAIALISIYISRTISKPIRELKEVADKLALGEVDIDIKADTKDEIGDLMRSFEEMISNTKLQAEAGARIGNGDLNVEIEPRSDKDILAFSMRSIVENLRNLVGETQTLTLAAARGELNTRGDADRFQGGFKEIIEGINSTLDGITVPLNVALDYIEKIANGEKLEALENNYSGKYAELIQHLMMVRDSLNLLLSETDSMTQAAFNGDFSYRPDLSLHKGEYANIMRSVSDAMAYLIAPFRTCEEYMRMIGNGEIPEKITEEYKGEFNNIKNSINACIEGLGGLIEGRDILVRMSVNDYTEQVKGSYLGIYAEIAESINSVSDTVSNLIRILNNISTGDLSDLAHLKEEGKRSENDTLRPALIMLMENIQLAIEEAMGLTNAVIEGRLDAKSDTDAFQGAWKMLVEGMNNILVEVARPLAEVSEVMEGISNGNLQVKVEGDYQGEFGELARSVNQTAGMLNEIVGEINEAISNIANGNLDLQNVRDYVGDFSSISESLNVIIDSLNHILKDINEAAEQVAAGSRQVSDGSQALSQGSTEQASSIEELSASIEELAEKTKQNALNANQANELAATAKNSAEKGNRQMQEMLKSMNDINDSSVNISKIIRVIDDIAFQTNILALNAAVEAARAGQHGKGFAVVAEEVRNLAARSAEAARNTAELIGGSIKSVEAGIKIADDTAAALTEIMAGIGKAADLVDNIAQASNEQASGIAQINKGIEQVAGVVQNNSATAEESAAASEELSGQAEMLKDMVSKFKLRQEMLELSGRRLALDSVSDKRLALDAASDKY